MNSDHRPHIALLVEGNLTALDLKIFDPLPPLPRAGRGHHAAPEPRGAEPLARRVGELRVAAQPTARTTSACTSTCATRLSKLV